MSHVKCDKRILKKCLTENWKRISKLLTFIHLETEEGN
jgi:hypothetical protein